MSESGISWTKYAISALWGCRACSAGCRLCYAVLRTLRLGMNNPAYHELVRTDSRGRHTFSGEVRFLPHHFNELFKEKQPSLFFCNEFSDVLHEKVPLWISVEHVDVAAQAYWHEVRLLTKRAERLTEFDAAVKAKHGTWPENVWMGLSVCEAQELDKIYQLQATSAAIRWLSIEPWLSNPNVPLRQSHPNLRSLLHGIDWIVIGGESASRFKARIMTLDDLRYWIEEARAAGAKVWVKQLGTALAYRLRAWGPRKEGEGKGKATAGAVMSRWPDDVRIQEFSRTPPRKPYGGEKIKRYRRGLIAWRSDLPAGDNLVQIRLGA
jgi:protein gp37